MKQIKIIVLLQVTLTRIRKTLNDINLYLLLMLNIIYVYLMIIVRSIIQAQEKMNKLSFPDNLTELEYLSFLTFFSG